MVAGRSLARAQRSVEPQICAADREEISPIVPPTVAAPRINVYRRPISAAYEALRTMYFILNQVVEPLV